MPIKWVFTRQGPGRWTAEQTGALEQETAAGIDGKAIVVDDGNTLGATLSIGTTDTQDLELIADGNVIATFKATGEVTFTGFIENSIETGITASTTQTQGQQPLTKQDNIISTVANAGDVVTAPPWAAGRHFEVIHRGAEIMSLYPASGDDLGAGADVLVSVLEGESLEFVGTTANKWERDADTSTFFGDFFEEENASAFVINAANEKHCYHDSGLAQGTENGWAFDAGGAGTSFPIASIADGADSGVDIEVTTTGAHGLATGAIVSQTNLADAAYVGVFKVKAIISATEYEVAAVFTATGTGTMNEPATLTCGVEAGGLYEIKWWASGTSASNNQTFEFNTFLDAVRVTGSEIRRTFGTGSDYGSMSGGSPPIAVVAGEKVSFCITNITSAGNMTLHTVLVFVKRL